MSRPRLLVVFVGPEGPTWPYGDGNGDSTTYQGSGSGGGTDGNFGDGTGDGSFTFHGADGDGWCQGSIDHIALLTVKENTE